MSRLCARLLRSRRRSFLTGLLVCRPVIFQHPLAPPQFAPRFAATVTAYAPSLSVFLGPYPLGVSSVCLCRYPVDCTSATSQFEGIPRGHLLRCTPSTTTAYYSFTCTPSLWRSSTSPPRRLVRLSQDRNTTTAVRTLQCLQLERCGARVHTVGGCWPGAGDLCRWCRAFSKDVVRPREERDMYRVSQRRVEH